MEKLGRPDLRQSLVEHQIADSHGIPWRTEVSDTRPAWIQTGGDDGSCEYAGASTSVLPPDLCHPQGPSALGDLRSGRPFLLLARLSAQATRCNARDRRREPLRFAARFRRKEINGIGVHHEFYPPKAHVLVNDCITQ